MSDANKILLAQLEQLKAESAKVNKQSKAIQKEAEGLDRMVFKWFSGFKLSK